MTILDVARDYVSRGYSVIPIRADGSKSPAISSWKELQSRLPTENELQRWFSRDVGIAIVCGPVSHNLVVLDFDSEDVWQLWRDQEATAEALHCPRVRTPSGGRHVYCQNVRQVVGNLKLAQRGDAKHPETLIETRGAGGYVLAPGCPPSCHPTGKTYEWERPLAE